MQMLLVQQENEQLRDKLNAARVMESAWQTGADAGTVLDCSE
jgi:hypothetical protein